MKKGGRQAKWEAGPHAMWAPLDMSDPYHPRPLPFFFHYSSSTPLALYLSHLPMCIIQPACCSNKKAVEPCPSLLMLIARAQREKAPLHSKQRDIFASSTC